MKLSEYLNLKHKGSRQKVLTRAEAEAIGIPYPLVKGWARRHADDEISPAMAEEITQALAKRVASPVIPGKRQKRAPYKRALNALNGGPVKVITVATQVAPMAKAPKQYKGPYIDPNGDEFLSSYQWRTLRMDAIVRYGNSCMCCGATPGGGNGVVVNVDHIKPRKTHPHLALDIENLQILCHVCNHGKSNRHETDFRPAELQSDGLEDYSMEAIGSLLSKLS
jgi:hypothetical protein